MLAVLLTVRGLLPARVEEIPGFAVARDPAGERRPVADRRVQDPAVAATPDAKVPAPVQRAATSLDAARLAIEPGHVLDRARGRLGDADVDQPAPSVTVARAERAERADRGEDARAVVRLQAERRDR